ncbi:MAG TPA: molybdate ABC transporter substrate-binding protein [Chondromyces sp.]|nr:molybdate ABC transporter substrate-binding protein [Chondromyces sp.]
MQKHVKLAIAFMFLFIFVAACSNNGDKEMAAESKESVELTISAAASLKDAIEVIQHTYQEQYPEVELRFNFGGSGSLQQQISQGAPVDLFFSAAEDKFDTLVEKGNILKEDGVNLLQNELVLIVPKKPDLNMTGFRDLAREEVNKIAMGTPEMVPAGKYAKESLQKMNIWEDVESKVVYAKDVRQVLSYVETGNVSAGIVYKTDALISDKVMVAAIADPKTHTPIIYQVGIIRDSNHYKEAKDFYNYLQSEEVLKVFRDYGFTTK